MAACQLGSIAHLPDNKVRTVEQKREAFYRGIERHQLPGELIPQLQSFIGQFPQAERDKLVLTLIGHQMKMQPKVAKWLPKNLPDYSEDPMEQLLPMEDERRYQIGIKDAKTCQALQKIYRNGYIVESGEAGNYLDLDFRLIVHSFSNTISDEIKEYLLILAAEAENHAYDDGGLVIEVQDLANRLGRIERFRTLYPKSPLNRKLDVYDKIYLRLYLAGALNTPVLHAEGMNQETWDSYEDYTSRYDSTRLTSLLKEYMALLERNKKRMTPQIKDFLKAHHVDVPLEAYFGYSSCLLWDNNIEDLNKAEQEAIAKGDKEYSWISSSGGRQDRPLQIQI